MDFTINKYRQLVAALMGVDNVELRHDVDEHPERALRIAKVEAEMGVRATYYFRSMHFEGYVETIREIAEMGHRVGYHYENLADCGGDMERAYADFCANLARLRQIAPVATACAHGSPRSKWDSQSLWNQYDIHALGIDYEPMMDTDFSRTLYLTDSGRRWDGYKVTVRDKVSGRQEEWEREGLAFHGTDDIIHAISDMHHPIHQKCLLINTHPQRWMPAGPAWAVELVGQRCKNVIKRILVAARDKNR